MTQSIQVTSWPSGNESSLRRIFRSDIVERMDQMEIPSLVTESNNPDLQVDGAETTDIESEVVLKVVASRQFCRTMD